MTEKKTFDARSLKTLDVNIRKVVDEQYELCLFKCGEKAGQGLANCKNSCFRRVIVPFKFNTHLSRDQEENQYRQCLAGKFPNVTPDDFVECTNQLYKDRIEILSDFLFKTSESILADLH